MKQVTAGIDIGGTNTQIGLVDRQGNCLTETNISTKAYKEPDVFLKTVYQKIEEIKNALSEKVEICGVGFGAPNGNYYNGTIEFAPNLEWKGIVKVVDIFKQYYKNIPIVLTNDANAAAVGEMIFGGAKGMRDFIEITLGTGVGSGIVVNGELVYGHDGFAGEIGHTIVDPNGRQCGCGRKGCLETYASAGGIVRTVFELLGKYTTPSKLRDVPFNKLTSKMITEAAQENDEIALKAFDYTGELLGLKLADSVAHTSPEAIFLFGGLAQAGDFIFKPTHSHMEKNMLNIYKNKVKLLPSGLKDKNIAILGASAIAWKEIDKK